MSKMDEVMKEFNTTAKEEIVKMGLTTYNFKRIPFTSPRMNYCTFGGLPVGKMIEFYGEEHGGKTTTALDIVANFQQMEDDRKVLWCDCENTLDVEWANKLGVDVESVYILKPTYQSAEEIFQFILDAIETDEIGLFVIDSLGVMASAQELDKDMEEKTYAGISQALTVFSRKAEMLMQRHQCTGIGINQIRDDMNSAWGGIKTPGGKAWKHVCSVRMMFTRGSFIDDKGNEIKRSSESPAGNIVLMSMTKNKSCPPTRRTGFYTINYDYGVDYLKDLVDLAIKYGIIDKSGAWFSILNPETGELIEKIQGQAGVNTYLEDPEHEDVLTMVETYIDSQIK